MIGRHRAKNAPEKLEAGRQRYLATTVGFFRKSISRPFQQATPT
jgi:hypothetical protein